MSPHERMEVYDANDVAYVVSIGDTDREYGVLNHGPDWVETEDGSWWRLSRLNRIVIREIH